MEENILEQLEIHVVVERQGLANLRRVGKTMAMGKELLGLVEAFNLGTLHSVREGTWRCLRDVRLILGFRGASTPSTINYVEELKASIIPHFEPLFRQSFHFSFEVDYSYFGDN